MKPLHILKGLPGGGLWKPSKPSIIADPSRLRTRDAGDVAELKRGLAAQKSAIEDTNKKVSDWLEKANAEITDNKTLSEETKSALTEVTTKATEALEKHANMEQELVEIRKSIQAREEVRKSLGTRFVEDEQVKKFLSREKGEKTTSMAFKSITEATTGTGDAGVLIEPTRVPGVITQPDRPMFIRQLLSNAETSSNAIEYVREQGFTNAAAPVAEGTEKPESDIQFELLTAPVRTLAHWIMASTQVLDDVPMLRGYIDQRLRYGLMLEEEEQILSGDGTGQNLLGLIPQATDFDVARAEPGDTRIDIVRRAMTQVRIAEYRPDAIVMHPDDWESVELTKTTEGAYVWASPTSLGSQTLWGLPVVTSTALETGEFLVGNFRMSATVWDRMAARIDVALEDRDNFIKNMVTIRGEERLALTVFRPEAMIYGDFNDIVTGG